MSASGVETDLEKCNKVKNWPIPTNADEVRSFVSFAGYYRRYVKDFSMIAKPLTDLLPPTSTKKNKKKQSQKEWRWTEMEQTAFDNLKDVLTKPPILAYPNFELPFELHIDACQKGLGAVLYNIQDKQRKVISYASRSLSKSEKNYSAYKLEFLALKWAVTEKFRDYLLGTHFTVLTDNNPLTHILTSAKLDATGQRWGSALGQFTFDIIYRPGIKNSDADGMSRYPFEQSEEKITLDDTTVKSICSSINTQAYIEILPCANINIVEVTEAGGQTMAQIEQREIRRKQREDKIIGKWVRAVLDKKLPNKNVFLTKEDQLMKKKFDSLTLRRGVLYREVLNKNDKTYQLVLPQCYIEDVLRGLHTDIGHPGRDRTLTLLRERFYWPNMTADVDKFISKCDRCIRRKSSTNIRSELININSTYPLELVCMDFLTLEMSKGGFGNILVITDHFTKFATAIPTKNQTAKTTAEALYNNFILNYGIPTKLHSDQGPNIESEIIKELCNMTGIQKSRPTIYHAMGNGLAERFNRTLLNMLGTLENSQKKDWKKYVPSLVYAYNCTPHETTKVAPFERMFGRKPKLPIDSVFQTDTERALPKDTNEYLKDLKDRIQTTQNIVKQHAEDAQKRQKKQFDKKAEASKISIGDYVLVKILAFEGKHKIADKFEEEVYEVVDQSRPDIPVFRVKSPTGLVKTLHRNHLLPVGNRDENQYDSQEPRPVPRKRKSQRESSVQVKNKDASNSENTVDKDSTVTEKVHSEKKIDMTDSESSDDEIGYEYVINTYVHGDAHDPQNTMGYRPLDRSRAGDTMLQSEGTHFSPLTEDKTYVTPSEEQSQCASESGQSLITEARREDRRTEIRNSGLDNQSGQSLIPEARSMEKRNEIRSSLENNTVPKSYSEETCLKRVYDERKTEVSREIDSETPRSNSDKEETILKRVSSENLGPVLDNRVQTTSNERSDDRNPSNDKEETEGVRNKEPTPIPQLRRSVRQRQAPAWFDSYQMNQIVPRPYDSRLEQLSVFLNSGVLSELDSENVRKIIKALMD